MPDEMTPRERFRAVMNFQPYDRLPLVEWAPWWDETIDRWKGEGLPCELEHRDDISDYFGLDPWRLDWFHPMAEDCPQAASHGAPIIETMDDYERILPHLYPWPLIDKEKWSRWAELRKEGQVVVWIAVNGFFWFPRVLLGIEAHLYAFYDQPELMHRINSDIADYHVRVLKELAPYGGPDFMTFAEDMSYNHGPMLSKAQFDEFLRPYYDRVVPFAREIGVIPFVDSDGDITEPVDWFAEAGLQGALPLERQAGVDVAVLRERQPEMRFVGCFDKMTMSKGEQAMRDEFERLLPIAAQGGLAIGCDHQTPPGVSLEQFRMYLRLFREYAEEAGRLSKRSRSGHS